MNVLIVGSGKGSWIMRGQQIGSALGARVTSAPMDSDWRWADVAVLIKRAGRQFASEARRHDVPFVWDALDFWTQPAQNNLDAGSARRLFESYRDEIRPAGVIGATRAMADACGGTYLPHHSWAGLQPLPAREAVSLVAYEGSERYLGRWRDWVDAACRARGLRFVVNPPDLRDVDLFVAFRDAQWDGWICREWKSGVKVGNAIAAGRPIIAQPSAAMRELQPAGATVNTPDELGLAFDSWMPYAARAAAVEVSRAQAVPLRLSAIADGYRRLLSTVGASCAA